MADDSFTHQVVCKSYRIEDLQVVQCFSCAEKAVWHSHSAPQGDDAAALRCAIEFCDDQTRQRHRGGERLCLADGILPHGCVEHEEGLMWRSRLSLAHHAHHLLELLAQA